MGIFINARGLNFLLKMAEKVKLPRFQGKPLIEIPEFIPQANFLEGDFGKAVFQEYSGRVKADYNGNSALDVLKYKDGVVKGSNPYAIVLMNKIFRQEGLGTAKPRDLGIILKTGALDLRGHYEDSALVLRSEENPNAYLARDLTRQIKEREKKGMPVMIPLSGLEELQVDSDAPHGLAFRLGDNAEITYSTKLSYKNNHKRFDETDDKGLPEFDKDGNRILYTRDSGLSRLCLGVDLVLFSDDGGVDLADSSDSGRVVVVSGEATSPEK